MATQDIQWARLEKVDLRKAWPDEARDFTPWLCEETNLKLLSETVGLPLSNPKREESVGRYKADIFCQAEEAPPHQVVIENQMSQTDHKHLGQLLTYAAGFKTKTMIWIAKKFTDEHRAAIDWLNENTEIETRFFGIEIELWQIDNSNYAPRFNIICQPNDWRRALSSGGDSGGGERALLYRKFFTDFLDFKGSDSDQGHKYSNNSWEFSKEIELSGFSLIVRANNFNTNIDKKFVAVDLFIPGGKALLPDGTDLSEHYYKALEIQKEEIIEEYGEELNFCPPDPDRQDRTTYYINIVQYNANLDNEESWPELHRWILDQIDNMKRVFNDRVNDLPHPPDSEE